MTDSILPPRGSAVTAAQFQPGQPYRILVVDDDDAIRIRNAEMLINSGYLVDTAEDGSVAWNNLRLKSYDLVVTDNNMPELSGIELLKKLHAAHMRLSIIMATRKLPEEEFARSPWLRTAAMLRKPYTTEELLATVEDVLYVAEIAR